MKQYMFAKTMKVLPRLKWLHVLVPAPVKEWLTASEKSFVAVVDHQPYSGKLKHPAETRFTRITETTPRP
jgi:hypothetical protein